jgi:hypothetical protein
VCTRGKKKKNLKSKIIKSHKIFLIDTKIINYSFLLAIVIKQRFSFVSGYPFALKSTKNSIDPTLPVRYKEVAIRKEEIAIVVISKNKRKSGQITQTVTPFSQGNQK